MSVVETITEQNKVLTIKSTTTHIQTSVLAHISSTHMEKSNNPAPLNNRGSGSIQMVADDDTYMPIPQFYAGRSIFITGGTGFMGKVLVEKLLRSCPDIKNIYLLIRTKRGKTVSTRLTELFNVPLFDTLRRENPKQLNKVIPISGDITMEELGISKSDQAILCRNVSIVFHSAATVRFDEKLKLSVVINMLGTKRLIELCHRMMSLDALIHVSTAYSNCDRAEVSEIIYDAPYKPDDIIALINLLPDDMLDNLTPSLLGKLPNTYTFTKALAEHVLLKEAGNLPVTIVRPSIVISSAKEPFAGWIDNFNGPLGLVCAMSRGLLRTMMCEKEYVANVIPVDTVINLMITVAWRTATTKSDSNPWIYNVCSGMYQPITWGELHKFALIQAHQNPVEGCLWYPTGDLSRNRPLNNTYGFLVHYIPAHIFDTVSRLTGKKPFMVSVQNKISKAVECLEYFATNQWRFKDDNVHALLSQMSSKDRDTFDFDVRTIDWGKYMERCMLGVREFLFKQQPDSLPESRKRMKRLYYLHHLTKFLTGTITVSFLIAYWIRLYDS